MITIIIIMQNEKTVIIITLLSSQRLFDTLQRCFCFLAGTEEVPKFLLGYVCAVTSVKTIKYIAL